MAADLEITGHQFEECINHDLCVVDFFAEWCMPCVMMAPVIEELAEKMKKVKFAKVNIDENQELARKFKILSIPNFILFKDGKKIDRFIGTMSAEDFEDKLKKHL